MSVSEVFILMLIIPLIVFHIYLLFLNIIIINILTDQRLQQIKYIFLTLLLWIFILIIIYLYRIITLNCFLTSMFSFVSFYEIFLRM